jgi:hypothetical protein
MLSPEETAFDAAYYASKPPEVQALAPANQGDDDKRLAAAIDLAKQGFLIDTQIDAWGWGPYKVMWLRGFDGIQSVNGLLGTGTIKTSLNIADYPPFTPAPPVPPPPASAVGFSLGKGSDGIETFAATFNANHSPLQDGQTYSDDPRGTFTYHAVNTPFGVSQWFTKN